MFAAGIASAVVAGVVPAAGALAVVALEYAAPYRAAWVHPHGDVRTDACHFVASLIVTEGVMRSIAVLTAHFTLGGSVLRSVWPSVWPAPAQVALALLLSDLGAYLSHRALHAMNSLWRLHRVHHSAPRLYWLNLARNHPLDVFLSTLLSLGLPALLGAGPVILAASSAILAVHLLVQHSNIELAPGFLDWVFCTARVHRWHHARIRQEADANYGQLFAVWDLIFGTRFVPPDRHPPEDVGLEASEPPMPPGWFAQLASPFIRK